MTRAYLPCCEEKHGNGKADTGLTLALSVAEAIQRCAVEIADANADRDRKRATQWRIARERLHAITIH